MNFTDTPPLTDEQLADFERDGFLVARGLLSTDETAEIRDIFDRENANGPVQGLSEINSAYTPDDPLSFYPRMMNPHTHPQRLVGPVALKYLLDSRFEGIIGGLFGEEAAAVQSMYYFKPPGARGQDLHQDNFYLRVKPGTCMAAWIAVDDADRENGGMVCVPGSHKTEVVCPEEADSKLYFTTAHVPPPPGMREEQVNLKSGDVLFFNGSVIHGSHPNTSKDRFRKALIFHYVPKASVELGQWYRAMTFDQKPLAIPEAIGGGPCGTPQAIKGPH